jgi:hypothetical protein
MNEGTAIAHPQHPGQYPARPVLLRQPHRQAWGMAIALGWGLTLGLAGCNPLGTMPTMLTGKDAIGAIAAGEQLAGDTVVVRGQVNARAPLVDAQLYQLQDASGEIWVLSTDTTVQLGDQLTIRGQVAYAQVETPGASPGQLYLQELEQLERSP